MLNCSVQIHIISRLESQSKFQMFALFSSCHFGVKQRYTNMAAPYSMAAGLCKFVQNISVNILSLGKHTDLKLRGEVSSL